MSRVMRKPEFYICENKGPDELQGHCAVDLHLSFRYLGSTIPLLPKFEIPSLELSYKGL